MQKNNKCVYFHLTPDTNTIFYVGIGNSKRPYDFRKRGWGARSKFWWNVVNIHGNPIVKIVHENLSYEDAKILEVEYIELIGRRDLGTGTLVNHTSGGEGVSNWGTEEQRLERSQKISESLKEYYRNLNDQQHKAISLSRSQFWSNLSTEEKRARISKTMQTFWNNATENEKIDRLSKLHSHESMKSELRSKRTSDSKKKMTSEQHRIAGIKREQNMSEESKIRRSEKMKSYFANLSSEEKKARIEKAWKTRRR